LDKKNKYFNPGHKKNQLKHVQMIKKTWRKENRR